MTLQVCTQTTPCFLCNNPIEPGAPLIVEQGKSFCSDECLKEALA